MVLTPTEYEKITDVVEGLSYTNEDSRREEFLVAMEVSSRTGQHEPKWGHFSSSDLTVVSSSYALVFFFPSRISVR